MTALRMCLVSVHILASAISLHRCRAWPLGWQRTPLALLIVVGNCLAPLAFHREREMIQFLLLGLNLMWLGNFKARSKGREAACLWNARTLG